MAGDNNSFAAALKQKSGSSPVELDAKSVDVLDGDRDQGSLAEQLFANTGAKLAPEDNDPQLPLEFRKQLEEAREKEQKAAELRNRVSPSQEQVVQIMDAKEQEAKQSLEQVRSELKQAVEQKQMPKAQAPKILDAEVVDPGEGHEYNKLYAAAQFAIAIFAPKEGLELWQERQGKRNAAIQGKKTHDQLHNERNAHLGA